MKHFEMIKAIKEHIELSLSELVDGSGDFNEGQRYAYVDTLEMVQSVLGKEERDAIGLDFSVEEVYPLK
ncbi:MAG: hypothetical protein LUI12_03360 [Clostridiales bacterium]|nr:hypothetical protein [Clostridiales bacterium]